MPWPKAAGGKRGLFILTTLWYHSIDREIREGAEGRNLESGTETEGIGEHCLLGFFPRVAQSAFK